MPALPDGARSGQGKEGSVRTWTRRRKAWVLWVVVYVVAGVLFAAVNAVAQRDVRTAQHGPVRPAPTSGMDPS